MGILYLTYSWWASRKRQDGIDHEAHFWGAAFGLLIGFSLKIAGPMPSVHWVYQRAPNGRPRAPFPILPKENNF